MEVKDKIISYVESCLEHPEHFVVSVSISGSKRPTVEIILDGDKGIDIDSCSKLSRKVGAWIEETNLIESAYVLEVGSPGVGSPLMLPRQFLANLGRKLQVLTLEGSHLEGRLVAADEAKLILQPDTPKKAKSEAPPAIEILVSQIKTAIVKVEF